MNSRSFYGEDLAHAHSQGFAIYWDGAAEWLAGLACAADVAPCSPTGSDRWHLWPAGADQPLVLGAHKKVYRHRTLLDWHARYRDTNKTGTNSQAKADDVNLRRESEVGNSGFFFSRNKVAGGFKHYRASLAPH